VQYISRNSIFILNDFILRASYTKEILVRTYVGAEAYRLQGQSVMRN